MSELIYSLRSGKESGNRCKQILAERVFHCEKVQISKELFLRKEP
jgi:hypothetical protein